MFFEWRGSAATGRSCGPSATAATGRRAGREVADAGRAAGARPDARSGSQPGDRVALVSENRPEWIVADLAIMSAGAVTVPAYTTNTVEDHRHILGNSGARAAIVSTAALAARLLPAARAGAERRAPSIAIEPVGRAAGRGRGCMPGTRCWRAARRQPDDDRRARSARSRRTTSPA